MQEHRFTTKDEDDSNNGDFLERERERERETEDWHMSERSCLLHFQQLSSSTKELVEEGKRSQLLAFYFLSLFITANFNGQKYEGNATQTEINDQDSSF